MLLEPNELRYVCEKIENMGAVDGEARCGDAPAPMPFAYMAALATKRMNGLLSTISRIPNINAIPDETLTLLYAAYEKGFSNGYYKTT